MAFQWLRHRNLGHLRPLPGGIEIGEAFERELRPILRSAEQRLGKCVIIADARARIGRLDAKPMQHSQHGGGLERGAVVAVQHRAYRHRMHALGERRSPGQVSRVLGRVGVMHLEADDLAAVEVQDQVEIEPASLDLRRQKRDIPAPDVARGGPDTRGGRARPRRFIWPCERSTR